jgi:twinkle protein
MGQYQRIKDRLHEQSLQVCQYLLPNGRKIFNEWKVGDFDNTKSNDVNGGSASVCLYGDDVGKWHDFANDNDKGQNLLTLWQRVRRINYLEAEQQAAEFLRMDLSIYEKNAPSVKYNVSPLKASASTRRIRKDGAAFRFLYERGITEETINKLQLGEEIDTTRFGPSPLSLTAIVFPYKSPHGVLTFIKYRRTDSKQFVIEKNRTPILFGWQSIDFTKPYVILVEGEIDQLTLTQYGFNALSVPLGGGDKAKNNWIQHEYDNLQRFDVIYLALDSDSTGKQASDDIAKRLGNDSEAERFLRIRRINFPYKDANECLLNGMTTADIMDCFENADDIDFNDPAEICRITDIREEILAYSSGIVGEGIGVELPWSRAKDKFRIRPGEVTIWAGYSGHGKSHLLNHIMVHCVSQGELAMLASMEMMPAITGAYMMKQAGGVPDMSIQYKNAVLDWLNERVWIVRILGDVSLSKILRLYKFAAKKYGITQFVLDSVSKLDFDEDNAREQRKIMNELQLFAKKYDAHVHVVAHVRKGFNEEAPPNKMDIKNSGAFSDLADNCIMVWRNKPKERAIRDGEDLSNHYSGDTIMRVVKQRLTGQEPMFELFMHREVGQWVQSDNERPTRYIKWVIPSVVEDSIPDFQEIA